jgi:hemolysin-activating ACP:hemolysin acyltransferase
MVVQSNTAPAVTPDEAQRRALAARRATTAFGQIVALMMRSPQHQGLTVEVLRTQTAPLVAAGQYALVGRRFRAGGLARPTAAVLWAQVSDAVDQRLSMPTAGPVRLAPGDVASGPIVWIVDILGEGAVVQAMLQRLGETRWKGRTVRVRATGPDNVPTVRTLGPF